MIYINNNANTTVRTESWLDYIPSTVLIYFNDTEIGEFENISTDMTYIIFTISKEIIESLKLENMDYIMKIYKDFALFKTELISVVSNNVLNVISPLSQTKIKMYEK